MDQKQIAPLTDEQVSAFVQKLASFRETLQPHEQAALDVMVLRTGATDDQGEVTGYDAGDGPHSGGGFAPAGDDVVAPTWRYGGVPYVPYYPVPAQAYYVPVAQPFVTPGFFYTSYNGLIRRW